MGLHRHDMVSTAAEADPDLDFELPRGPDLIVLLVFNDPEAPRSHYGLGWTLEAFQGSTWCWWQSLAGDGAAADVDTAHAQQAAERALAQRGMPVQTWREGAVGDLAMYRATPAARPNVSSPRGADGAVWSTGRPS